jgi:serine/threonine protein kinase
MANQRPIATTQSLSLDSYTGPDGHRVPTYGTFFLGRYRVVDEIGVGGMASVHLARLDGAGGFQKWVAIKRIHPHLVEDDQFVHMFLDEARIAARINHANVAQVYELGEGEGNYWIAMEYLHGEPLREVMRSVEEGAPAMAYEVAARIVAEAAEGLHAAHDLRGKGGEPLGLVHRDVTPHNIFVTYEGQIKVVDFGIAKVAGRLSNTRAGTLKGKLAYMSPEQVAGREIDRRTDIFALGVVLWELTTNQRLFRTDSDLETLEKVQACQIPRPSQLRRDYPLQLEQILLKALARDANQRFQTARDLSRELQKFLLSRGMLVGPEHVSDYVHRLFGDRIRKRDEHLRWAAEVTQTINVDDFHRQQGVVDPADVSMVSHNSEVLPARNPRGPQALPGPGLAPRAIEAGLPLPSIPTGPLPAPRPPALKGTMRLSPGVPGAPTPLPSFGGTPPPSSAPHAQYDDDDEDLQTIVAPTKSLLIDDSMPTVALAHQPGAVVHPATLPAAGVPPPVPANPNQYSPPPVPGAAVTPYLAPAPQPYPAPAPHDHGAPPVSESPTYVPPYQPAAPQPVPAALPSEQAQLLQRDPTLQLSSIRRQRQMGLTILASVAGTLALVGAIALVLLRGKENLSQDASSATPPQETSPKATATATPDSNTTAPSPTATETSPVTSPSTLSTATATAKVPTTATTPVAKTPPPEKTAPPTEKTDSLPEKVDKTPAASGGNGFLTVVCKPACDSVIVKGRNLGPSPVVNVAFPAGTYPVVLKRSGSPPKSSSVTITAGKNTPLRVNM